MTQQPMTQKTAGLPPQTLMRWAVIGAGLLVLAGGAAFYYASKQIARHGPSGAVVVTINDRTCDPNSLTVPAGRTTFKIVNASERAVEWEIIQGVMVVEERENILPGFSQTLTAKLPAGDFEITCGLLSHPRGSLHVTPSKAASAEAARPALTAFIGPLAEYQVYLAGQSAALIKAAQALDTAIQAGDLQQARALYAEARRPYKRIEPVAERFGDLENAIDPLADYLEKREDDPAFTGFHRLEYGLFAKNSTDGLAPVSAKLVTDVTALKDRLRTLRLSPDQMTDNAARLASAMAETKLAAGEDHYAGTDLADLSDTLDGIAKIIALLKPVAANAAPDAVADIEQRLGAARDAVNALKGPQGFPPYGQVDAKARENLAKQMGALAAAIGKLNEAVGLG
jgi:iron uptake system EfeUOB component EfeO/EfeM